MSTPDVAVVRRAIDALNRRDVELAETVFSPDVEIDWSRSHGPLRGVYHGHAGLHFLWDEFWGNFEEVHLEADDFVVDGQEVRVPSTAHMRGRAGIDVMARSTFAYLVEGGCVKRMRLFQEHPELSTADGGAGAGD